MERRMKGGSKFESKTKQKHSAITRATQGQRAKLLSHRTLSSHDQNYLHCPVPHDLRSHAQETCLITYSCVCSFPPF
jgi:hypothetical protein